MILFWECLCMMYIIMCVWTLCSFVYLHAFKCVCVLWIPFLLTQIKPMTPHLIRWEQHRIHAGHQHPLHPPSCSSDLGHRNSCPHLRPVRGNIPLCCLPAPACQRSTQRGWGCFFLPSLLPVIHLQDLAGEPQPSASEARKQVCVTVSCQVLSCVHFRL